MELRRYSLLVQFVYSISALFAISCTGGQFEMSRNSDSASSAERKSSREAPASEQGEQSSESADLETQSQNDPEEGEVSLPVNVTGAFLACADRKVNQTEAVIGCQISTKRGYVPVDEDRSIDIRMTLQSGDSSQVIYAAGPNTHLHTLIQIKAKTQAALSKTLETAKITGKYADKNPASRFEVMADLASARSQGVLNFPDIDFDPIAQNESPFDETSCQSWGKKFEGSCYYLAWVDESCETTCNRRGLVPDIAATDLANKPQYCGRIVDLLTDRPEGFTSVAIAASPLPFPCKLGSGVAFYSTNGPVDVTIQDEFSQAVCSCTD